MHICIHMRIHIHIHVVHCLCLFACLSRIGASAGPALPRGRPAASPMSICYDIIHIYIYMHNTI